MRLTSAKQTAASSTRPLRPTSRPVGESAELVPVRVRVGPRRRRWTTWLCALGLRSVACTSPNEGVSAPRCSASTRRLTKARPESHIASRRGGSPGRWADGLPRCGGCSRVPGSRAQKKLPGRRSSPCAVTRRSRARCSRREDCHLADLLQLVRRNLDTDALIGVRIWIVGHHERVERRCG